MRECGSGLGTVGRGVGWGGSRSVQREGPWRMASWYSIGSYEN